MNRVREETLTQAHQLQLACDAVADAHGVEHRVIEANPYTALTSAKAEADLHVHHDGNWPAGSCEAELFALEWEIYSAEHPAPRPGLWPRLVAALLNRRGQHA